MTIEETEPLQLSSEVTPLQSLLRAYT